MTQERGKNQKKTTICRVQSLMVHGSHLRHFVTHEWTCHCLNIVTKRAEDSYFIFSLLKMISLAITQPIAAAKQCLRATVLSCRRLLPQQRELSSLPHQLAQRMIVGSMVSLSQSRFHVSEEVNNRNCFERRGGGAAEFRNVLCWE